MLRSLSLFALAASLCLASSIVRAEEPSESEEVPCELLPGTEPPEEPPPRSVKAPALPPIEPLVVSRVSRAGRRIALTFDACSVKGCAQYDERITKVLEDTQTPATIFLGGRWAMEQPEHVRQLAANPLLELGNHTWWHPNMTHVSSSRRRAEILRTQDEVYALTGQVPHLFRPPFGTYDAEVVKDVAALGLVTVEFDLASGDPDQHATKERLIEWVLRKAGPGSIVVMHINRRGWHTAEALPAIIEGLHDRGYELVTVGALLKLAPPDPAEKQATGYARATTHKPAFTRITRCTRMGIRAGFDPPAGCAAHPSWLNRPGDVARSGR